MKTTYFRLIAMASLVVMLLGVWDAGAATTVRALNFASVGVIKGQSIQINFTNNGSDPLKINFLILDDDGKNYLPAVQREVFPGRTVHATLNAQEIPFLEGRTDVRAKVLVSGDRSINFFGSAEVINNDTLKTEIFLPAVQ
jgi:hypothetical protein